MCGINVNNFELVPRSLTRSVSVAGAHDLPHPVADRVEADVDGHRALLVEQGRVVGGHVRS